MTRKDNRVLIELIDNVKGQCFAIGLSGSAVIVVLISLVKKILEAYNMDPAQRAYSSIFGLLAGLVFVSIICYKTVKMMGETSRQIEMEMEQ